MILSIFIFGYRCTHVFWFYTLIRKPCVLRHCVGFAIPLTHSAHGAMFNYHMHGEDNQFLFDFMMNMTIYIPIGMI